ncbi:amino acid ABC transporter membrane protein (PAAT family) [Mobilisporobacter senegalensis]|uniref:Amino acid ABC transporter membrane protein (PAAT family) n=1 Tax=Mobilisporobacter senegalensis TaxID=1329262 RepID=A0A3N1XA86_9FIRM|nr:amino acid ABC transporter permease [Mobilisporobacter senegalensis]ROR23653.1 amino acid ABC transporter membrane protein (PAAT family) [Mobilisporobacter senegalensis]
MDARTIEILQNSFMKILIPGLTYTIPLTLISFFLGLVLALLVALIQIADIKVLKHVAKFYVWIIRGTPLLVQIFIIFYGLPNIGIILDPLPAAIIAFSLNVGAYASETLRAAILSVPKGQLEAGYCVGLSYFKTMRLIILPQAFKTAFPPLFNSFIGLVKDTSLAANITVTEMFMATQQIAAKLYEPLILYCEVAVIYLFFCTVLSKIQKYGEKRMSMSQ